MKEEIEKKDTNAETLDTDNMISNSDELIPLTRYNPKEFFSELKVILEKFVVPHSPTLAKAIYNMAEITCEIHRDWRSKMGDYDHPAEDAGINVPEQ